jgi:hypothetical protein
VSLGLIKNDVQQCAIQKARYNPEGFLQGGAALLQAKDADQSAEKHGNREYPA